MTLLEEVEQNVLGSDHWMREVEERAVLLLESGTVRIESDLW